ncbi:MAG: Asp-tRNA(Asn)/Glu-tRNA(Gln) amidotransferase subunit GatC [Candidatus Shapirobacteria bacterium]|jgi:aspartyl-tRNA(Asn)/glutamyl-tRNA(Gln) amidotransferase subunit C
MSLPKISMVELEHIAKLARINLSESEKNTFLPQLESVLNSFDVLNKINTDNVEPTFRVNKQSNVFRQDEIKESLPQSVALSTAAVTKDGYFVVTNTIKK